MTEPWFPNLRSFDLLDESARQTLMGLCDDFADAAFGCLRFGALRAPVSAYGIDTSPSCEVIALIFVAGPNGSRRGMRPLFLRIVDCEELQWSSGTQWALIDEDVEFDASSGIEIRWTGFAVRGASAYAYLGTVVPEGLEVDLDRIMWAFVSLAEADVAGE